MTIASEITRLQTDKEAMRQAIIDKGVDVASNVSFDDYAACIAEISTGPKTGYIDLLVVGGGGSGGHCNDRGGGGGAGGYREISCYPITQGDTFCVTIGAGGMCVANNSDGCNGGDTTFGTITSCGGGGGARSGRALCGHNGGSGGGGGYYGGAYPGGCGTSGQGHDGGCGFGGGGGAGGAGCNGICGGGDGTGGAGCSSSISGSLQWYSGGGAGACGVGCNGGGDWGCSATTYGSGGGGKGCGCQGIVILRYKTDGSMKICNTSYGGCKYTCGDYTIHCFTNTGAAEEFIPVFK